MVKLGITIFAVIMFLFCILIYVGVSMKGILIVYFALLGIVSLLTLCLFMSKKKRQRGRKNE